MKSRSLLPYLFIFACLLRVAVPVNAQVLYGTLTGNITDSTGAALPGARIEASNIATGLKKEVTTDDRGAYLFNDLQPGTYNVTISATSFGTLRQENIDISVNTIRRVDAKLHVAQVNESVTVGAS